MGRDGLAPGSAGLQLAGGAALLRPEEQVLAAMQDGWRAQQLARNLAFSTIEKRLGAIRAVCPGASAPVPAQSSVSPGSSSRPRRSRRSSDKANGMGVSVII